jgi:hypothetical protein
MALKEKDTGRRALMWAHLVPQLIERRDWGEKQLEDTIADLVNRKATIRRDRLLSLLNSKKSMLQETVGLPYPVEARAGGLETRACHLANCQYGNTSREPDGGLQSILPQSGVFGKRKDGARKYCHS